MAMDLLLFERPGARRLEYGWNGAWPPPEFMVIVVGTTSGEAAVTDPQEPEAPKLLAECRARGYEITEYARASCSALPDDVVEHPNLCRVAVYEEKA